MLVNYMYIGIIVALLIIIIVLIINYRNKVQYYIDKKEIIENQYYMQLKHYERYINNYNQYRKFKHDIKNSLIILDIFMNRNEYGKVREELNSIKEELEGINIINYTNNIKLDSVLYNMNEICKIKSIDFKVNINICNNENEKIQNLIEFLIYSLYSFIEISDKEIICKIKENENNLILFIESISINKYNKVEINDIIHKLKEKAKALNITIEFINDDNFVVKCLL